MKKGRRIDGKIPSDHHDFNTLNKIKKENYQQKLNNLNIYHKLKQQTAEEKNKMNLRKKEKGKSHPLRKEKRKKEQKKVPNNYITKL